MKYNFVKIETRGEEIKEWMKKELSGLRTGRATPAIVENVLVDSYGSRTPLKHVAAISVEDAKTIRITPWDYSLLKNIEHSIINSNVGAQPIADKDSIRITLPELTEDRRKSLVKVLIEKMEEAKISLRKTREEVWSDIQEKERAGEIPEDDKFRFKDELQKIIDNITNDLTVISEKKKTEIMN